ncbi:MAG: hypothetical protein NVS2B16_32220 [Chloroflexota bacterium]
MSIIMERVYDVVVHNELTDEVRTVSLLSASAQDAQVDALVTLFRSHGWRKACTVRVSMATLRRAG